MFDLSPHLATSEIIFAWSRYDKNVNFTLLWLWSQNDNDWSWMLWGVKMDRRFNIYLTFIADKLGWLIVDVGSLDNVYCIVLKVGLHEP